MSNSTLTRPTACARGAITELLFCAAAGLRGWNIYTPFGHAHHVDIYIVRPGVKPIGVQVKTIQNDKGCRRISCGYGSSSKTAYAADAFDVLAAYNRDTEEFCFYGIKDVTGRKDIFVATTPGQGWESLDTITAMKTKRTTTPPPARPIDAWHCADGVWHIQSRSAEASADMRKAKLRRIAYAVCGPHLVTFEGTHDDAKRMIKEYGGRFLK